MRPPTITRRRLLGSGLAALAFAGPTAAAEARASATALRFRLKETAGLRRFGYPVHTLLPGSPPGPNFRLERDGLAVAAQFRPVRGAVALDFNASPGPLETEVYTVRSGPEVEPGPEPKTGMTVERNGATFRVANGSVLAFTVPADRAGLLSEVRNARLDFWQGGSPGLWLRTRDGATANLADAGSSTATVTRQGPIAVGLRFEGAPGEPAVRSTVEMTFPNSKSWVEVRWTVDDPEGRIAGLGADLRLRIDGESTLVDLGAGQTVYGRLRGRERMTLEAGDVPGLPGLRAPWVVRKGPPGALSPFATAVAPGATPAEGWAHVMDPSRCTAVAVAGFGRSARDKIEVDAGGRLAISRTFPEGAPKALAFWLHFVNNPVQVGAATSPQAMLAPLTVDWGRPDG